MSSHCKISNKNMLVFYTMIGSLILVTITTLLSFNSRISAIENRVGNMEHNSTQLQASALEKPGADNSNTSMEGDYLTSDGTWKVTFIGDIVRLGAFSKIERGKNIRHMPMAGNFKIESDKVSAFVYVGAIKEMVVFRIISESTIECLIGPEERFPHFKSHSQLVKAE